MKCFFILVHHGGASEPLAYAGNAAHKGSLDRDLLYWKDQFAAKKIRGYAALEVTWSFETGTTVKVLEQEIGTPIKVVELNVAAKRPQKRPKGKTIGAAGGLPTMAPGLLAQWAAMPALHDDLAELVPVDFNPEVAE